MDKINAIINKNNRLLESINAIEKIVSSETLKDARYADIVFLKSLESKARSINKRIKDNVATINNLTSKIPEDTDYYELLAESFRKKSIYVDSNIPNTIQTSNAMLIEVIYKNGGMFYSWTQDKGIELNIEMYDLDNNLIFENAFPLNDIPENEPGDESENGDYLTIKKFIFELEIFPTPPGEHRIALSVSENGVKFKDRHSIIVNLEN